MSCPRTVKNCKMCSVEHCFDRTEPFDNQALLSQLEIPVYKGPDEIDNWLSENVHIQPGCCSSIEALKYSVARAVAEKLWPKKELSLTWENIYSIIYIYFGVFREGQFNQDEVQQLCEEVLRRFNEQEEQK